MLIETYIEILDNFRNSALVKVSVWIIAEMTHRLCTLSSLFRSGGEKFVNRGPRNWQYFVLCWSLLRKLFDYTHYRGEPDEVVSDLDDF